MSLCKTIILLTMLILAAWLFLAGCGVDQSSNATLLGTLLETLPPDPAGLYAQAGSSQSTAQAAASTAQYFGSQLTATFQQHNWDATTTWSAANLTATQQSWSATATAESNQATSTAAAESDQATSTAAAQLAANATTAAATQVAFDVTATADYADARTYATAMAGQAASVDLGVKRDIMMNNVKAAAPWVVSALVLGLALFIGGRVARVRIIRTGQFGDKPLLLDLKDGVVTDPDLSIHPQTGTRLADVKRLPVPSAEAQAQAKMRDQMIDLGTRGTSPTDQYSQPSPRRRAAAGLMSAAAALPIQTQVTLLPSDQAEGMVRDVIPAIVRDATGVDIDEEDKK